MSLNDATMPPTSTLPLDRRQVLIGGAALGLGAGGLASGAAAAETPKKGGTLRLGMEGGSASSGLDPRTFDDSIPISYGWQLYNNLVEIGPDGDIVGELAERFEPKNGGRSWIFDLRKGVAFTSGKTLDADDVIYSLNLHRGDTKSGAKDQFAPVTDIRKLNAGQIEIVLREPNVEFPSVLTDYHIVMVPDGFTAWNKPDGTGAYRLETFEPGVRVITRAKGDYWKPGRGNFDAVDLRFIPDPSARTQALITGQVDAVNRLDARTVGLLMRSPAVQVVRTKGVGSRFAFVARCIDEPYTSNDLRLALKYGIDRQRIVDTVYKGYATIGNDTTIAPSSKYFGADIPQHSYDPDRAASYFKKAGLSNAKLELQVSDGCFAGAVDAGLLYQEALRKAGITLDLKRAPADGYWSNVWLKAPFCSAYWGSRANIDSQLSQTFLSDASWNDTAWKNPAFDALVIAARGEMDEARRRQMYHDAQQMIVDTGGMVCFAIGDYLDGYGKKVMGVGPHQGFDMCNERIAEKAWFA